MEQPTARIFDVQKFSLHDGPGIRTTVFFKGCSLRCAWCHNPEGLEREIQSSRRGDVRYGYDAGLGELLEQVMADRAFYQASRGGVTCSGGECMLQAAFLRPFLGECKQQGVHTAVDTAGNVPWEAFERVLPVTDLFLYDLKAGTPETHLRYTGADNGRIWENLRRLTALGKRVWIRIPVIREVNAKEEEFGRMASFLGEIGFRQRIDLLAYHTYGRNKYRALYGVEQALFTPPERQELEELGKLLGKTGAEVHITG